MYLKIWRFCLFFVLAKVRMAQFICCSLLGPFTETCHLLPFKIERGRERGKGRRQGEGEGRRGEVVFFASFEKVRMCKLKNESICKGWTVATLQTQNVLICPTYVITKGSKEARSVCPTASLRNMYIARRSASKTVFHMSECLFFTAVLSLQ